MSTLSIINLTIGYGSKVLAKDLNLSLNTGEFIGLIGQNGVGKSTLLRTLCGFQKQLGGKILIDDQDSSQLKPKEVAKQMAVVLTERPQAMNLTVLELISLGRHPYSGWLGQLSSSDIDAIEGALELTQIHYILDKRLYELSDGQLQKVMIARALAQDTDFVILDEPTSHLDLRNKAEVLEVLRNVTDSGKGILITSHEINLAAKVCDKFWCMDFGTPIVSGKPTTLLTDGTVQKLLHLKEGIL